MCEERAPIPVYWIEDHPKIEEHFEKIKVEHMIYSIFIASNEMTPDIFYHCIDSQTPLTVRDAELTRISLN